MNLLKQTLGLGLGAAALATLPWSATARPLSPDAGVVVVEVPAASFGYYGNPFLCNLLMEGTVQSATLNGDGNTVVDLGDAGLSNDQFNGSEVASTTTSQTVLVNNTNGHTLQINSGEFRGRNLEIIDTIEDGANDKIVVFGDFVDELYPSNQEGTEFYVIKDWTLNSLIGEDTAESPLPSGWVKGGFDSETADIVAVINRAGTNYTVYYFRDGFGWVQAGFPVTAVGDRDFLSSINAGFIIARPSSTNSALEIALSGVARVGQQVVDLSYQHDSVLGIFLLINPFEKALPLNSFAQAAGGGSLFDAIEPAATIFDVETGDNVIFFDENDTQQFVISDDTGFRLSSKLFAPASPSGDVYWGDDIKIQPGQAMLVFRAQSSSDATVVISQPFTP